MEGRKLLVRQVPFPVELEREPENPAHENAIKIVIGSEMKLSQLRGMHLGYVRAASSDLLTPRLDDGTLIVVSAQVIEVDSEKGQAEVEVRFADVKKPVTKPKRSS
jgi:hypothetical protein